LRDNWTLSCMQN